MILRAVRIDAMPGSKLTGKIKVLTIRRETNKSASRFQVTWRLSILVSKQQQVRRLKRTFYQSLVFNFSPRVEWKRHVLCVVCMSFPMLIILYYIQNDALCWIHHYIAVNRIQNITISMQIMYYNKWANYAYQHDTKYFKFSRVE